VQSADSLVPQSDSESDSESDIKQPSAALAGPGFTLIEIMVVIVVISILAGIAILHLAPLKDKGYETTLIEDLRNLETAEEAYFIEYATYTPSLPQENYMPSAKNTYSITTATVTGWSAVATTSQAMVSAPSTCHIAAGTAETTASEYPGTVYCP
jgi:prepilin-type N-terminal cleavage/methylation domain-containing protein